MARVEKKVLEQAWGAARRTKQPRHDKLQDVNYITQLRHKCELCFVNLSLNSLPLGGFRAS